MPISFPSGKHLTLALTHHSQGFQDSPPAKWVLPYQPNGLGYC